MPGENCVRNRPLFVGIPQFVHFVKQGLSFLTIEPWNPEPGTIPCLIQYTVSVREKFCFRDIAGLNTTVDPVAYCDVWR